MRESGRAKTSLFLMELVIVILFFALCGAICMRIFAVSGGMASDSRNINESVLVSQSAAESYKGSEGNLDVVANVMSGSNKGDQVVVYYDSSWEIADKETASFCLTLTPDLENKANIKVENIEKKEEIFSLSIKR